MVITSGLVNVELPMDSEEADQENQTENGTTHLYVFSRGCVQVALFSQHCASFMTKTHFQGFCWRQCCCWGQAMDWIVWRKCRLGCQNPLLCSTHSDARHSGGALQAIFAGIIFLEKYSVMCSIVLPNRTSWKNLNSYLSNAALRGQGGCIRNTKKELIIACIWAL